MAHNDTRQGFTAWQREELSGLGLVAEQVAHLEHNALRAISWRLRPPPRMADVREILGGLAKALDAVERLYVQMYTLGTSAHVEAASRLDTAQEAQGFNPLSHEGMDKLHDSLDAATSIVSRALQDLPKDQRRRRLDYPLFVRKILWDLQAGHAEHFMNHGKPIGAFQIKVARKKPPFPQIAQIVSEASGGWSADDAIEKYLRCFRQNRETRDRRLLLRKRH